MPDAPGDDASDWGLLEPLAFGSGSCALTGDDAVLAALIAVEAALTGAWADAGLAPAWLEEIASSLSGARVDRDALRRGARAGGNPVIPLVAALRDYTDRERPGAGDWIHRGATSQDILDSALMLVASRAIVVVADRLDNLGARLADLADEHRGSLMPGRTLTQHAAPITFGAKVAGWLDGVESAIAALGRIEPPVQLAGSVGIGSSFVDLTGSPDAPAALRAGLAARLGLADPGRSWQAERSPVTRLASALATALGALGRIAADLLVLARTEVAEVAEGGAGSSSAMPQKRNPATAVLIVAAAGRSPGLLSTLFSAMASADERAAGEWHSEWQALRQLLALAVEASEASAALFAGLVVDADRMRANVDLTAGLIYSEEVFSRLTRDRGRAEATAMVASAIDGPTPFAEAVPMELSTATTLVAAATVVDAALARRAARLRKRDAS
ncbi:lyase family protein [Lacisediminihabitans profunda]|uniref:lyase family protein n=1 Tax=Lacisediminihabitans profunda TaxID=2594790 RepID=UPI001C9BD5BE|nr:lyase family protein [Lacisediminihabitans profunda]